MHLDIDITPGVCGACDGLPTEYLIVNWDILKANVFRREEGLYDIALVGCAVANRQNGNRSMGYAVFSALLTDGPANGFDYKKDDIVARAIFDKYWTLAKRDDFWEVANGPYRTQISFAQAIGIWKQIGIEEIEFCRKRLTSWLKTN